MGARCRRECQAVEGAAKRESMKISIGPRVGSGCGAVLVDEPAAGGVTSDRLDWADRDDVVEVVGCGLVQAAVVSTHAKSVATIAFAWEQMNSDHEGPVRSRRGSMPAARMTFHTVDAATG